MRILVALILSTFILSCGIAATSPSIGKESPALRKAPRLSPLEEAQRKCTFGGRPIHRKAIHLLLGSLADSQPVVLAVDVGGVADSNDYVADGVEVEQDVVRYRDDTVSAGYVRLGTLTNGVVVLRAGESGGGSGIFESLLCVRFERSAGLPGQKGERLIMRTMEILPLGDRTDENVQVRPDCIIIGKPGAKDGKVLRF